MFKKNLEEGINLISKQGGYYNPPFLSAYYLGNEVAYFYYSGQNLMPSIEKIESEIFKYINENLNLCLNDFKPFKEEALQIEWKIKNISIEIIDNKVVLKADLPIRVIINNVETDISNFMVTVSKKLNTFYEVANELIESQKQEPNSIFIGKLI